MKFFNLRLFRQERNLFQWQFAEKVGITQSTASYLENASQEVTDYLLEKISQSFNVEDLSPYIYHQDSFGLQTFAAQKRIRQSNQTYKGDWNELRPIAYIDNFPIICKLGNVNVCPDGTILVLPPEILKIESGAYIIGPSRLNKESLLLKLTEKQWFNDSMFENFKRAYVIACALAKTKPAKQIKPSI